MKRKLLITIILAFVLACMLAISISAEAYDATRTEIEYTDIDGVTHKVPVVKYADATAETVASSLNNNATVQARFIDNGAYAILKATDGTLTAYPTWYIIEPSGSAANYVAISEIEYTYVNAKSGKTYENGAIRYIEFPDGMTAVRNNGVFGLKTNGNPYETNVTDFYIPKTVNSIEENAFNSMPYIQNVFIEAGNSISAIKSSTFSTSSIKYVQFENLTEITSIDGFSSCGITGDIDLSNCTKLTAIQGGCFQNSKNIGKITLPDSVETIGNHAFSGIGNAYLASPYLPANLTSIGERFFAYCDAINDTFIFPEGVTSLGNEPFQDSVVAGGPTGKELNLVFLGKVTGVVYLNGNGHQKHAEKVTVYFAQNSLSDYNQNGFKIKPSGSSTTSVPGAIRAVFCAGTGAGTNGNVTGIEYVYITNTDGTSWTTDYVNNADYGFDFDNHTHYGAQKITEATCGKDGVRGVDCIVCDNTIGEVIPATGNHTLEDDGNCETEVICSVCQNVVIEALSHVLGEKYEYPNGYLVVGVYTNGCLNSGCSHGETTEIPALATSKGYSQEQGTEKGAIVFGITFDHNAIKAYEKYLGAKIDFGLIASSVQDGAPLNEDASAKTGTVKSSFANASYSIFQIKLTDIESAQWNKLFHCGGYFVVNGEISYVNNKTTGTASELVSYNIVTTLVDAATSTEQKQTL